MGFRMIVGKGARIAVAALFCWATVAEPILAQAPPVVPPPAPAAQQPIYKIGDLEYLLGPIALFPDPLLAVLLPAAAFPLQIVQADRWIVSNPKLVEQGDFSQVDAMPLDPSVQALTRFPDVIKMLADHLDWTQSLGMAFALQAEDVATTIQMLRAKAEDLGNLKTTPEQVVTRRDDGGRQVIYIVPANPERIYVPVYNPAVMFVSPLPSVLVFTTGIIVGSAWNNRWGWNNRTWNQVWINPPAWHPPPPNWRPPGRPPGARPPGVWRPDRPGGVRPDRPGVRPDRPGVRPDRPPARPDRPAARPPQRPDRPAARPPAARPDRPVARPDRPAAQPDRPAARPQRPAARPDRPAALPDRPAARPAQRPAARPAQRPQQRPAAQRPAASRPAARPAQTQRARPQQGAQPQGSGQQQRTRPQRPEPQ